MRHQQGAGASIEECTRQVLRAVGSGTDDVRATARRAQAYIQRRYSSDTVGKQIWGRLQELMARVG